MKKILLSIMVAIFLTSCMMTPDTNSKSVLLINNVNLLSMSDDSQLIMEGANILIINDKIAAISDQQILDIPKETTIIDGTGKYMIPGLIDMHIHLTDPNELKMYVANGVTTVRSLGDYIQKSENELSWQDDSYYSRSPELRSKVLSGSIIGPDMYLAGNILDGPVATVDGLTMPIESIDDIDDIIRQQIAYGYDYIKVYDSLPADFYYKILDEADKHGIKVIGHMPVELNWQDAYTSGLYTNEHLTIFRDGYSISTMLQNGSFVPTLFPLHQQSNLAHCPTLSAYSNVLNPESEQFQLFFNKPEWEYLSETTKSNVYTFLSEHQYDGVYMGELIDIYWNPLTNILNQIGAPILVGTDAPFAIPGFAMHDELQLLVNAGMSEYEVLKAATFNAAENLEMLDTFGTIEVGKRADIVLLSSNPLEEISATKDIDTVILRGELFTKDNIENMLETLK